MTLEATVDYLFSLRRQKRRDDSMPEELTPSSLDLAYEAQARLVAQLCETHGSRRVGYKAALTSPAAQSMLGVPHPVYGTLLEHSTYDSGVSLEAADFTVRIIEVEFAFRIGTDIPAPSEPYDAESIAAFVSSLHPAIEIVDHRFEALASINAFALASDNAIHGGFVLGPKVPGWETNDLATAPAKLVVNGADNVSGAGDRALGNPLNALAWLANEVPAHGLSLCAGDCVTTGLVTDGIYEASAGDHLVGDFGALGKVEVTFV